MEELKYFSRVSHWNEKLVCDLRDVLAKKRRAAAAARRKNARLSKAPVASPEKAREKKSKIKTTVLQENEDKVEAKQPLIEEDKSDKSTEENDSGLQFSKVHVETHPSMRQQKGKNRYQKLREAAYREKAEAEDEVGTAWDKVQKAARGEKVELTTKQIQKKMKNERKSKRKKFEKKVRKAEERKPSKGNRNDKMKRKMKH